MWTLDHISKAASCIIEYETEWNVDVNRDEDVNVNADEDPTGGGPDTLMRRFPSVLSVSIPLINQQGGGRNAMAKKESILSETLELDRHLPSFKNGVGIFLPASDWTEAMLALKLKGAVFLSHLFLRPFTFLMTLITLSFFSFWQCKFKRQKISIKEETTTYGKGQSSVCRQWKSRLC